MVAVMVSVSLGAMSACTRNRARTEPEVPPLAAPLPPPRVLPPLEGGPIEAAVPTTAEEPPSEPRPTPRRRSETARTAEAASRPDTKPDGTPPETPPAEASPPSAGETLQIAPAGNEAQAEAAVRRQLAQANQDLGRVDYRVLGVDARAQYDTAKRFITLTEQAIRDRNLIFAQTLADKAAAIAAVLAR